MSVRVRRAEKSDAQAIAEMAIKLVEQHVDYDPIRFSRIGNRQGMANFYGGQTEAENAAVFVAESSKDVIGFAYMQFEPIIYAELAVKVAWLHDIFVEEKVRRTGAGEMLLKAAADAARSLGANKILLSVAARNAGAQAFFARHGFVTTMHEMMLALDQK
jgi:GNAT superfamily N-acetyltransferase